MYCQRCGAQTPDGMMYCQNCGAPLEGAPRPAAGGFAPPPVQPVAPAQPTNPVLAFLKSQAASPLFLTGAIAFSLSLLFQLGGAFSVGNSLRQMLRFMMDMAPSSAYDYEYYAMQEALSMIGRSTSMGAVIGALIGMIPSILVAIGMWLVFATARDKSGMPMKTTGLTMIRVISIIRVVCTILALVGIEALIVLFAFSAGDDDILLPVIIIMLVVAVFYLVALFYHVKVVATLATMRDSVQSLTPSEDVSLFVAVCNYIIVAGQVISTFTSLSVGNVLGALGNLAMGVSYIVFGIFLFDYKNKMGILLRGGTLPQSAPVYQTVPPVYQPPVYPPQPAPQPVVQPVAARGETTVLSEQNGPYNGDTTVLNEQPKAVARLIRLKDNSVTLVNKPVIHIGKDPATCECAITDNTAVSHDHADVVVHGSQFFIVDKNSTNHVYVGGSTIPIGVETLLSNGAEIRIANEPFRFEIC